MICQSGSFYMFFAAMTDGDAHVMQVSWQELCCMCGHLIGQTKRHAGLKTSLKSGATGASSSALLCLLSGSASYHKCM